MHAILRRYEGVDRERTDEMVEKVNESLMPRLSELPGFGGYYLIDADGVMSSISIFETSAQADDSTRLVSEWIRDQKLEEALPNPPKVTSGTVITHKTNDVPVAV
jgi:hypothetical protein